MPPQPDSRLFVLRATALLAVALLLTTLATASAHAQTAPAFSAYATGVALHADALRTQDSRLADVEVSFSGASLSSTGYASAVRNEVGRVVSDLAKDKRSASRGAALEVGLNVPSDEDNQIIVAGKAATAAPGDADASREIGPLKGSPLAYASLLFGRAHSLYDGTTCVLGDDASRGTSGVADLELLGSGAALPDGRLGNPLLTLNAAAPDRVTVGSVSRTRFVAQVGRDGKTLGDRLGLLSESRLTFAPVTLFSGTPNETTVEILGEWVLRTVATGISGGAWVQYGPADVSPETPVVRVIRGETVSNIVRTQDLFGDAGLRIEIPGVGELVIGEDARGIGGTYASDPVASATGTDAAAAVDVVRVKLFEANGGADIRIGHLESSVTVPPGGISCPIPVTKTPNPTTVPVGQTFVTDIAIRNPFDCDLRNLAATDEIASRDAARYETREISDVGTYAGDDATGSIDWPALGTLRAGATKPLSARFLASAGPGVIADTVFVSGTCGVTDASGSTTVQVTLTGTAVATVSVNGTRVLGVREELPATGVPAAALMAIGAMLAAGGVMLRRYALDA